MPSLIFPENFSIQLVEKRIAVLFLQPNSLQKASMRSPLSRSADHPPILPATQNTLAALYAIRARGLSVSVWPRTVSADFHERDSAD